LWEKGKKRRQTLTGGRACQREAEQRELQTTQPSSLEEPSEASCNELPLHRDPLLPVCDRSGDISHQLSQDHLKDGKASHLCVASTVPGTEASFVLSSLLTGNQAGHSAPALPPEPLPLAPSILSPNCFAPLEGFYSATLLHDSLTPESTLPLNPSLLPDPTPPYPLASFPLPTREVQKSEVVFQLETMRSLVDRLNEMPTNVPPAQGTGCVRQTMPEAPQQQPAADNQSSDSKNQYLPAPHVPQVPLQGDTRACHVEPGYLFFPNSNAVKLFQRLDKKVSDFLMVKEEQEEWEEEEDKGCFIKSPRSSEKLLSRETSGEPQDFVASHSSSSKGKLTHQPLPHSKTFEDHEELQSSLLFWGPPSLHSEALSPTTTNAYDRSSALVCFNSMAEASIADYSHGCMLPTPLHAYQPQTWLQTEPQSHPQRDPPAELQPQPQPQSRVSVLTFSHQSELRDCGVHFHRPQGDEQPLSSSEMQCLEYNILKKEQERVWGLPLVVKKSQDTFCPSPPKVLLGSRSSKACTPRPILPGDFPLTSELQKKLEHHLRKRLIQHRWGLPDRIDKSLSLMSPQSELIDFSESKKNRGLSWITFFKYQGNKDSQVLSGGNSRNRMPRRHSLRETRVKERTYSQDRGHNDQSWGNNFQEASQNSVQSHLKTHRKSRTGRQPPRFSSPSQVKQYQRGIEKALEKHLNKKIREISRGEIPITVDRSRHSVNMANIAQPPPETSPKRMKDLAPLACKEHVLMRHPHSLALSPSKEKMLEEHITTFRRRMAFGLPQRVEESLESYSTKAEPSQPFPQLHVQAHNVSRADPAKSSRSLRRTTTGDRMGTVTSVPTQQRPLPAASIVGHSQPASENKKVGVDRDLSIAPRGREPTQHWTPRRADKGDVQQSGSHNRPGPELPMMSPGGPTHERLASSTNTQGSQEERRSQEDGSEAEGSTELHKGEQLPGLHPQSTKSLKGTQDLCSPGSPVTACQSPQGMSVLHNSESPDSKSQVSTEVQLNSEGGTHNQVPDLPATPFAPQEMTSKPQGPSGGDMAVSQVLRVHMPTVGISMESRQGPWVPAYVSGKSKNKDCLPAARGLPQLATEAGKFGGGDAGLGTSQTTGKGHCVQARAPEETQGLTASPALTPKSQPQENQFTSQVKGFWQRLSPGKKHKGQEKSLAKGCSPLASGKGTSPIKGRSEFCGNPEAQNCVREPGMVLRKQLGHRHGTVTPCPQVPVSPLMGSEGAQQEVPLQAQAEPVQRLPHLCCRGSCSPVPRAESCSPGQGQTAPERCGPTGKAKRVETSPVLASPPKSSL
uniref:Spermatogenesis associated 31 subfamily D, member 1B n=1 Tax=Mus spicilegus TaxID=10103 RepID=A0A8C6MZU0_MUSSI